MFITYSKQWITKNDLKYVSSSLKEDFLTQGKSVKNFEKLISKKVNCKFCLTVNSASSALLLSCIASGLTKGDYAWTVPITYAATANSIISTGAEVDFVDINSSTFNICTSSLKKKLSNTKKDKLPKVLIVVHLGGEPCDMKEIYKLSKKYKFKIIEDASHALGSKYRSSKIGSCEYSESTVFSFHPVKTITTGEGGCITTNSKKIFEYIHAIRSGGIIKEKKNLINKNLPSWYYEQHYLGFNLRLSDINAALGLSQLKRLSSFESLRSKIRKRYVKHLQNLDLDIQITNKKNKTSNHLFIIKVKKDRDKLFEFLKKNKIICNLHYIPLYRHPFYKNKKIQIHKKFMKNSEEYFKNALSLPIHPLLKKNQQIKIINLIKIFLRN